VVVFGILQENNPENNKKLFCIIWIFYHKSTTYHDTYLAGNNVGIAGKRKYESVKDAVTEGLLISG
jgi:hypothetical protein